MPISCTAHCDTQNIWAFWPCLSETIATIGSVLLRICLVIYKHLLDVLLNLESRVLVELDAHCNIHYLSLTVSSANILETSPSFTDKSSNKQRKPQPNSKLWQSFLAFISTACCYFLLCGFVLEYQHSNCLEFSCHLVSLLFGLEKCLTLTVAKQKTDCCQNSHKSM